MYEVQLFGKAEEYYAEAQRPLARKLARCFEVLEQTPHRHPNIKRLKGSYHGLLHYRVGDYRVIYRIDDESQRVFVLDIAHRRDAYA